MADDDIVLDDPAEESTRAPAKAKSATPVWAVILVLLSFACLAATLALQVMQYQHFSDL